MVDELLCFVLRVQRGYTYLSPMPVHRIFPNFQLTSIGMGYIENQI